MTRKRSWIAVFCLLLLAVAVAVVALRLSRGPVLAVQRVGRAEIVERVVVSGRVLPRARIQMASVLPGRVAQVAVREGDAVRAGQSLLMLDVAEARAALTQAVASLAQAQARLDQTRTIDSAVARQAHKQADATLEAAELQFERVQALLRVGGATQAELEDKRRALQVAQAQHATAEAQAQSLGPRGAMHQVAVAAYEQAAANLAAAQVRLDQNTLIAPVDAVVLTRSAEPGDVVSQGQVVLVLARSGETRLTVQPDEKNLAFMKRGLAARASADAFPQQSFDAVVDYVAPSVDPQRGTVEVRLGVPSPPAFLRPDMTVSVDIEVGRKPGALVVPAQAVRDAETPHPYAFSLRDGRVVRHAVALGLRGDTNVEVTRGLREGDLVILHPSPELREGNRARASGGK